MYLNVNVRIASSRAVVPQKPAQIAVELTEPLKAEHEARRDDGERQGNVEIEHMPAAANLAENNGPRGAGRIALERREIKVLVISAVLALAEAWQVGSHTRLSAL